MDLSEPRDAMCPLCRGNPECDDHRVEIQENKAGRPYFHCPQHKTPINMNGGDVSEAVLSENIETLAQAEDEVESGENDDGPDLTDLFSND